MIQIRKLPASEYDRLAEVNEGLVPPPNRSVTLVAEREGQIIGRVFLVEPLHVEGPWVAESERGTTLGARLMQSAEKVAGQLGAKTMFAYGASDTLEDYLARLGYRKMPLTVWQKDLS